MEIIDSGLFHAFGDFPKGEKVEKSEKLYSQAKGFYESIDSSLPDGTVMYEVYVVNADKIEEGYLNWGLSVLNPVTVNGECNMTRGHFHADLNCEEYYWTSNGTGLLMYMDEEGKCWCESMKPGTLHHINGHYAHRLINTGEEQLRVVCVWNSNAGHDYQRVEKMPFPYRVFKENGKIIVKER